MTAACASCKAYQAALRDLQVEVEAATGPEQEKLREQLVTGTLMYSKHVINGHSWTAVGRCGVCGSDGDRSGCQDCQGVAAPAPQAREPAPTPEERQWDALAHTHDTGTDHWGGRWAWRCDGHQHCTGDISLGHLTQEAAASSYLRHLDECHGAEPTEKQLHERRACPGWEYATTEGPRKQWDDADRPPSDEHGDPDPTWERNVDAGRGGWDRFDHTEESYWRRRITRADTPAPPH